MSDDQPARYAIVLTHNRPELLAECVAAIAPQVDLVIVIDNASNPPVALDDLPTSGADVLLLPIPDQPPNLARFWNIGLELCATAAAEVGAEAWDVAVLCDDAIVPVGWVNTVSVAIRGHGCAAGSTHQSTAVASPIVKTAMDSDIHNRMCGWAFMLRGEVGYRADETLHWWWIDTSADITARLAGGMVIAAGPVVVNALPNAWTNAVPALAARTVKDREAFRAKHGSVPW